MSLVYKCGEERIIDVSLARIGYYIYLELSDKIFRKDIEFGSPTNTNVIDISLIDILNFDNNAMSLTI